MVSKKIKYIVDINISLALPGRLFMAIWLKLPFKNKAKNVLFNILLKTVFLYKCKIKTNRSKHPWNILLANQIDNLLIFKI